MTETNSSIGFTTRYGIAAIDPETGETGERVWVESLLLDSGYAAFGRDSAYTHVSVGASAIAPHPAQENLIAPIATIALSNGTFTQEITKTESASVVSTITREVIFKDFAFPANLREITVNEVGIVGVSRGVLDNPVRITQNNWISLIVQVEYIYQRQVLSSVDIKVNNQPSEGVLTYNVDPFIYNESPANTNGTGWGLVNSVLGYVWDGTPEGVSNRNYTQTLGLQVTVFQEPSLNRTRFNVTGAFLQNAIIPGFIIRDVLNGGAFKITFHDVGLVVEEDDTINIDFVFTWKPTPKIHS